MTDTQYTEDINGEDGMPSKKRDVSLEQFTTPGSQTHQASPILRKRGMTGTPAFPSLKQHTTLGSQPHFSHARLWLDIRASPTDGRLSPTHEHPLGYQSQCLHGLCYDW